jgi:hypothetical protein
MNLGQWLGQWAGQWFGALEEAPPGFISGTATLSLTASGTLTAEGTPVTPPVTTGGNWTPALQAPRRRRPIEEDEALLLAVLG